DAPRVEVRPRGDPVEERANVLVGPLAENAVVHLEERLPVARRPADVRADDGHAELVDGVVPRADEARPRLALRTPMDLDRDGPPARELRGIRTVQETRDLAPVEALPGDELGLGEGLGVQAAELARRPALELAGLHVPRIRIRVRAGRLHGEADRGPVRVPADSRHRAERQ